MNDKRIKIYRYRLEPYYPRMELKGEPSVHYMLSLPKPLDKEQMTLILTMISEMRSPRDYYTNGVMLDAHHWMEDE